MLLTAIGLLPLTGRVSIPLEEFFPFLPLQSIGGGTPQVLPSPSVESSSGTVTDTALPPAPGTVEVCVLVWAEHAADDLGGKNRAMVWEEVVLSQVRGSGMTPQEFYDLVLQHNPDLVRDGYEFKRGKTYLLPTCQ
jgi:hypothetical protein